MRPCSIEVEARLGKADDVAGRVDVRHAGLEGPRIDREAAAIVAVEAAGVEVEVVGRADPAGGIEQHLRAHVRPSSSRMGSASPMRSIRFDLAAEAHRDAAVAQVVDEFSMISRSMNSRIWSRGSISVTGTSSALKMVAYSMPITPAPTTVRLRGRR